jgi:hypothetical protein
VAVVPGRCAAVSHSVTNPIEMAGAASTDPNC